jgi:hypothetical protein
MAKRGEYLLHNSTASFVATGAYTRTEGRYSDIKAWLTFQTKAVLDVV